VSAPAPAGRFAGWVQFWFFPVDPIGLHVLRLLGGLLFLVWLLPFAGNPQALFGLGGWFDAKAYSEASRLAELPPHLFSWSVLYLCGTDPVRLGVAYWLSLVVIALFTFGLWTRLTGVLTWVVVVSFTANPAIASDVDPLLLMLAFYLMVGHLLLGQRTPGLSLSARLLGTRDTWLWGRSNWRDEENRTPSVGANLAVRLFQVHFAIAMLASGLHKLQIKEWWAGLASWFYLYKPFDTTLEEVRGYAPHAETYLMIFTFISYVALVWQIAFPVFAWRPAWRPLLIGGAVLGWVANLVFLRLPLFGPLLMIGCLSYVSPQGWRRLTSAIGQRLKPALATRKPIVDSRQPIVESRS
jgi:hypothetical protein